MPDYDDAEAPPDTPPVIDPTVSPKAAAEMEAEGEREGPVLQGGAADSKTESRDDETQDPVVKAETNLPPD